MWVLGEYGSLAAPPPAQIGRQQAQVTETHRRASDNVKMYVVSALAKICAQVVTSVVTSVCPPHRQ